MFFFCSSASDIPYITATLIIKEARYFIYSPRTPSLHQAVNYQRIALYGEVRIYYIISYRVSIKVAQEMLSICF